MLWIGKNTITPLHHDLTNNLLCQVMGRKFVRLFSPEHAPKLSMTTGVHSTIGWVDDEVVVERGLSPIDIWLEPGRALFIPVGWWHCIKAQDVSVTALFTNFIWPNDYQIDFPDQR